MIGQTISHYRITAKLGEGGMGVVYKAEDSKLERTVALKFLAAHLVSDAEVRKRFEREAKAAAALNHPNICHVYEIDEVDGKTFIAMAFIEGQGLDEKIAAGPLKLNEALDIAHQIAQGLQAAHAKGIVHRDIKPANVMISGSGSQRQVTIMDFGLALLTEQSKLTRLDETMGTIAYMSPEQTMGTEVDHRADLWALGVVLYEMVSGQRPFKGHYDKAVMYSITAEEPEPLTAVRTGVPMELEWIVGKCLAKEADNRYRHADELAGDLNNLHEKLKSGRSTILRTSVPPGVSPVTSLAQPPQASAATVASLPAEGVFLPKRKLRVLQGLLALLALITLAFASIRFREAPAENPIYELTVDLPRGAPIHTFNLSPDGRHVVLALGDSEGDRQLWVRSMDSVKPRELAGTEGARNPFWSPDSGYIGFFAQGKLKKVALAGGPPQSLCDAEDGRGGTWNANGIIVFAPSPYGQIQRVPEGGGDPVALTKVELSAGRISLRFPWFLPDGRHFLYSHSGAEPEQTGIYLGSTDGIEPVRLLPDDSNAIYDRGASGESGFILFFREDALMAQPFDPARLEMTGDAFPVTDFVGGVANRGNYGFSVSAHGSLLYVRGSGLRPPQSQLAWVDRAGNQIQTLGKPASIGDISLSPDETKAALSLWQGRALPDIWLLDFSRGTMLRVTSDPGPDIRPVWSPDGRRIAYSSERAGPFGIYQKEIESAGNEEVLLENRDPAVTGAGAFLKDWSPDGWFLLYRVQRPETSIDLWVLPLEGDRTPYAYQESKFQEDEGRFSPDGRWVAYESDESGRSEVFVRPFPAADRKWQISTQGGAMPAWSKDGRELYYIGPEGSLMAVAIKLGDTMEAGSPQALFQVRLAVSRSGHAYRLYDVSRDGRFLIANPIGEGLDDAQTLLLLSDWHAKVGK